MHESSNYLSKTSSKASKLRPRITMLPVDNYATPHSTIVTLQAHTLLSALVPTHNGEDAQRLHNRTSGPSGSI